MERKKRQEPPRACTLDGEAEAKPIAMRVGKPPAGYGHWTLQLLAEAMVALEIVEAIGDETIRRTRKKNGITQRKIAYGVMPPEQDAECVASREDVLET